MKSRQVIKEVVDGQQRTQALVLFYNDKQRLTSNIDTVELRGLRYGQLSDEWQSKFLSYSLPIDQFSGTSDNEVREAFRRMNANNVPLNDEEQRNALFQGDFKWFIVRIGDKYQHHLHKLGLFSRRDLIRMSDLKLYAEMTLALDSGFSTVKGKQLDDIYRKYNGAFSTEAKFDRQISSAVEYVLSRPDLHQSIFLRGHVFQSLALAGLANADENVRTTLIREHDQPVVERIRSQAVSIEILASALQDPENYSGLQEFIDACSKKTNVEDSKRVRFLYFYFGLQNQE